MLPPRTFRDIEVFEKALEGKTLHELATEYMVGDLHVANIVKSTARKVLFYLYRYHPDIHFSPKETVVLAGELVLDRKEEWKHFLMQYKQHQQEQVKLSGLAKRGPPPRAKRSNLAI